MKCLEFDAFVEEHKDYIEWKDDMEGNLCFRNTRLAWYQNHEKGYTAIPYDKVGEMNADQLMFAINKGLEVENITRITGYMTKVSSWNPGKIGELKDRNRMDLQGNSQHAGVCPVQNVA